MVSVMPVVPMVSGQLVACCLLSLVKRFTVMLPDLFFFFFFFFFSADCQKVTHQHTACKLYGQQSYSEIYVLCHGLKELKTLTY